MRKESKVKFSRWILRAATLVVLIIVVTLSAVIATRRVTTQAQGHSQEQVQNQSQRQDRSAHAVAWRRNGRRFTSSSAGLNVNLLGLPDQADWIVGAAPVEEGEQEEVRVGIVHWEDSGTGGRLRIERIARIEDYPSDLVEVTSDAVNVRGSDALLGENTTLILFMNVRPEAAIRLLRDGERIAESNAAFDRRGFAVRNYMPIGTPISGVHTLLVHLQADRITRNVRERSREVTPHENR